MSEFKNAILLYQDENDVETISEHDLQDYKMGRINTVSEHDLQDYKMGRIKTKLDKNLGNPEIP